MPGLESKHPLLITAAKVTIKLETTKKFLHFLEIEITIVTTQHPCRKLLVNKA